MRVLITCLFTFQVSAALADPACKQQVDDAFAKLRSEKAFRLETTIKNADGTLKMQADYVLPDRMHQRITLGGDGTPMEMIVIGKQAWSNQGGGWAALPQAFADTVSNQIKDTLVDPPKGVTDYTCLGDQTFEGKTYTVYDGLLTPPTADAKPHEAAPAPAAAKTKQSIYIDKQTGLPARNIVTSISEPDKRLFDGTFSVVSDLHIDPPATTAN